MAVAATALFGVALVAVSFAVGRHRGLSRRYGSLRALAYSWLDNPPQPGPAHSPG